MRAKFTKSFKMQAVKKVLNRDEAESVKDVADSLGIGFSTLQTWIRKAKGMSLVSQDTAEREMNKEKRPQDWTLEERLEMVITSGSLNEEQLSEHCRREGIYPHHVKQWKIDFAGGNTQNQKGKSSVDTKSLRQQNKELKKQLNRKDKALAETAALLVLQKKVNAIWGSDEDDTQ